MLSFRRGVTVGVVVLLALSCCLHLTVANEDDDEAVVETERIESEPEEEIEIIYVSPKEPTHAYLAENFDDQTSFDKKWIRSKAKKDGVDSEISKYDGVWALENAEKDSLVHDLGLILKSKAKHSAISVALRKPFKFDKPLVVQYEVNLQNGQECGGAYIKLLSYGPGGVDLKNFNDKTPYTIMFGPDKCGNDFKLHFIFRHVNPLTDEIEEKHAKRPHSKFEEPFKDKRPHLYTLLINTDNTYEVRLDHEVVSTGSLLEDFTPPVNPPKEIDDPNDKRPSDWDDKEKIVDSDATKPADWDDDAAMQIPDPSASMPDGWLEEEPEMVPDPDAIKQDDWDDDMDGEWEAPLISNPKCQDIPGCGEWKPAMVDNPDYKGKWKSPMINNPNYQGKWSPRRIVNPNYYEDLEPYKMTPISAVGLELWSMSDGIYFDNLIVTDSETEAYHYAQETFDLKIAKIDHGQTGVLKRILDYSNKHPWLYGIYVVLVAIPVVLIFACCCAEDKSKDKKKTDEPTEDDPPPLEGEDDDEGGEEPTGDEAGGEEPSGEEVEDVEEPKSNDEQEPKSNDEQEPKSNDEQETKSNDEQEPKSNDEQEPQEQEEPEETNTRTSPRLRKARKE